MTEVLASWRDRLLFGVVALIGFGWLTQSPQLRLQAVPDRVMYGILALVFLAAVGSTLSATRRLRDFVDRSLFCADALCLRVRSCYRTIYQAPIATLALAVLLAVKGHKPELASWAVALTVSMIVGAILPTIVAWPFELSSCRPMPSLGLEGGLPPVYSDRLWVIVAEGQTMTRNKWAALAVPIGLAICIALLVTVAERAAGPLPGVLTLGSLTLAALVALTRIDDEVVRFAAFAGFGPFATLTAHLVPGGIFSLALALLELVVSPQPLQAVAIIVGVALLVMVIAAFRSWSYRFRSRQAADLMIRGDVLATAVLGSAMPPLAPVWIIVRTLIIYRAARQATWAAF